MVYGNKFYNTIDENAEVIDEAAILENSVGLQTIMDARSNPNTVPVYLSEDGAAYIATSDFQRYCDNSGEFDLNEAFSQICEANELDINSVALALDECDEEFAEALAESGIVLEAAAEDGATTVRKVSKWYGKFVNASKTKAESVELIDARIKCLKDCVKQMEDTLHDVNGEKSKGRLKYVLKGWFIPFNGIYRLIKRDDVYAGIEGGLKIASVGAGAAIGGGIGKAAMSKAIADGGVNAASTVAGAMVKAGKVGNALGVATNVAGIIIRAAFYEKMLESNIKKTKEAIKFLEDKRKELKAGK